RVTQRPAVDHPRVDDEVQVDHRHRGEAGPVQALYGAEGQAGRQLQAAQPGDLLDVLLLQPAVAADREAAGELAGRGQLQGRDQVVDVAELPARPGALDGEQARCLEMPGDRGLDAVADQRGGADHGDVKARVGRGGPAGQLLDLQQVADHAAVQVGG